MNRIQSIAIVVGMALSSMAWAQNPALEGERPETDQHQWHEFTVPYPSERWELKVVQADDKRTLLLLNPKLETGLVVQLGLIRDIPKVDEKYLENPHMASIACVLSPALDIANNDESRIFLSTGTAATPAGWGTSSRATVLLEGGAAIHLEGFHEVNPQRGLMLTAIVRTESRAGDVDQRPEHAAQIKEAYEIVRRIRTEEPTSDAE